jgi:hypothetical protein
MRIVDCLDCFRADSSSALEHVRVGVSVTLDITFVLLMRKHPCKGCSASELFSEQDIYRNNVHTSAEEIIQFGSWRIFWTD